MEFELNISTLPSPTQSMLVRNVSKEIGKTTLILKKVIQGLNIKNLLECFNNIFQNEFN